MASIVVKHNPDWPALNSLRSDVSQVTKILNDAPARSGNWGFARIYVGPIQADPRTGEESFLVSHSDTDEEADRLIWHTLGNAVHTHYEVQQFYAQRDPFLAELLR